MALEMHEMTLDDVTMIWTVLAGLV